jgi:hypothetical protein
MTLAKREGNKNKRFARTRTKNHYKTWRIIVIDQALWIESQREARQILWEGFSGG